MQGGSLRTITSGSDTRIRATPTHIPSRLRREEARESCSWLTVVVKCSEHGRFVGWIVETSSEWKVRGRITVFRGAATAVREQDYPSILAASGDRPPMCRVVTSGSGLPSLGESSSQGGNIPRGLQLRQIRTQYIAARKDVKPRVVLDGPWQIGSIWGSHETMQLHGIPLTGRVNPPLPPTGLVTTAPRSRLNEWVN